MPRQATFSVIPETLTPESAATSKRAMTSKQAQKLYRERHRQPKMTRQEMRRWELQEQERIRKELEKDKQLNRARFLREKKKQQEKEKLEQKKKTGQPIAPPRPSQPMITGFVRKKAEKPVQQPAIEEKGSPACRPAPPPPPPQPSPPSPLRDHTPEVTAQQDGKDVEPQNSAQRPASIATNVHQLGDAGLWCKDEPMQGQDQIPTKLDRLASDIQSGHREIREQIPENSLQSPKLARCVRERQTSERLGPPRSSLPRLTSRKKSENGEMRQSVSPPSVQKATLSRNAEEQTAAVRGQTQREVTDDNKLADSIQPSPKRMAEGLIIMKKASPTSVQQLNSTHGRAKPPTRSVQAPLPGRQNQHRADEGYGPATSAQGPIGSRRLTGHRGTQERGLWGEGENGFPSQSKASAGSVQQPGSKLQDATKENNRTIPSTQAFNMEAEEIDWDCIMVVEKEDGLDKTSRPKQSISKRVETPSRRPLEPLRASVSNSRPPSHIRPQTTTQPGEPKRMGNGVQKPKYLPPHLRTQTTRPAPARNSEPKVQRPARHSPQKAPPTSTQLFLLSNFDELFPSVSQEARELSLPAPNPPKPVSKRPPVPAFVKPANPPKVPGHPPARAASAKPLPAPKLAKAASNVVDISFLSTQDLVMSSQDLREISVPAGTPLRAGPPVFLKPKVETPTLSQSGRPVAPGRQFLPKRR
ncbi:hypothetical protein QBC42DRAFT_250050 [Cladorrhinum samala]|uniref:Uncharacterized protein n=1 Tax=Cladorrhinum samala TaxID=585594 RepID=A0AAV9HU31_9PEZI|nr:hypothetical protein QBC42DRAFT_250050 [Cladorrhinum samala]